MGRIGELFFICLHGILSGCPLCIPWIKSSKRCHLRFEKCASEDSILRFSSQQLLYKLVALLVGVLIKGRYRLNTHMHKLRIVKDSTCRPCGLNEETSDHVVGEWESIEGRKEACLGEKQLLLHRLFSNPMETL